MNKQEKRMQQNLNSTIESLRVAGHTKAQIIEALDKQFAAQEQEDGTLLEVATALSLEDVKVNTSTLPHSSLRSISAAGLSSASELDSHMAVVSSKSGGGKLKASAIADEKEGSDNDFYIKPEDLVQDYEEPVQQLSEEQRKRVGSKDSESSTETIVGKTDGGSRSKARFSLGSKTATLGDRGRTASGPQVEHALAYVVYESIAKKAIAGQKISQAAGKIVEAFKAFPISSDAALEMRDRMGEIAVEAMRFRTTKRSLKAQKESDPDFLSQEYDAAHDALIIAARVEYAKMISSAMDVCLLGANKMPNVSYPTEGVDPNPNTGKEKEAKNNLLLLSNFLGRVAGASGSEEKKADLLDDSALLEKLEKKWGITKDAVTAIFAGSEAEDFDLEDQLSDIILPTVQAQLTQHMGELFYYPSLQTTHHYTINGIAENWAVSKDDWCDVMKINPETEERIRGKTPKYNKGTLPRSNDLDEMVKTVGQAQVGFAHMLPELALFGDEKYKEIMDGFLVNSAINNSKENGGKGRGEMIAGLQIDGTPIEKLSYKTKEFFEINYANPRESHLKRSSPAATATTEHEVDGGR